ncbi:hypothetical protein BBFL7_00936 [Flavobacteria bacterium BBFL7]|nr:hypothetical protein BBFL7_00936 [Flavobacteria bacterium BBFL7]
MNNKVKKELVLSMFSMIIFEQIFKMKKYLLFVLLSIVSINVQANCEDLNTFTVVIDRGHDNVDKGAIVDDESEFDILSSLVAEITGELTSNIKVIYHNPTGSRMTLEERAAQINALKPDLVISIHMGFSDNGPRQAAIVLNDKNMGFEKSKEHASSLITHLSKDAYFSTIRTEVTGVALLEKVNAPAFMLEIGNMNASRDRYYLQSNGSKRVSLNFTAFLNDLN